MSSRRNNDRRIYVGNLHPDSRSRDLEELFENYGKIIDINLVSGKGRFERAPFAFVEFEDPRDARDAVDRRDGYYFMGRKIRVEFPKGDRDRSSGGGGGGGGGHRGGDDRRPRGAAVRRTKYRVMVAGLPASASWQDLKDHMRSAGEVAYSDVYKDGSGVVEFTRYDDMRYAVKNLEDSKFKSHEGETAYISVKEDYEEEARSRSKSRSRSRGRSPASPSPRKHHRRRASKSVSPRPTAGRSPSPDARRRR